MEDDEGVGGEDGRLSPSLVSAEERRAQAPWNPVPLSSGQPVNFDPKWEGIFAGDDPAPTFKRPELAEAIGVLMRRLDHCEAARREDRMHLLELKAENKDLRKRVGELQTALTTAAKGALYCKDAPPFDPSPIWAPRNMSIPEAQWLQEALNKLRENDPRIPEIAHILGIVPEEGRVCIDLSKAEARKLWQLYYYLMHKKLYRRHTLPLRAAQRHREIDEAGPSSLEMQQGLMENWDDDDDDFGFGNGWNIN